MAPLVRYFRTPDPAHYKVKIEKYSTIAKKSKLSRHESRNFSAGGCRWALIVYPKGNKSGHGYLSLELRLVQISKINAGEEIWVDAKLFIYHFSDDKWTVQDVGKLWRYHGVHTTWGIDKFVSLNELKTKYLQNDSIIVGVEILVVKYTNKGTSLTIDSLPSQNRRPHYWDKTTRHYSKRASPKTFLREAAPAHYKLEIRNLSAIFFNSNRFRLYESPNFIVGGIKWKLLAYPNTYKNGTISHLSFGLGLADESMVNNGEEILVNAKLFIYDRDVDRFLTVQDVEKVWHYDNITTSWVFDKFMPVMDIHSYVKTDSIIIGAEILIVNNVGNGESLTIKYPTNKRTLTFLWKIRNFKKLWTGRRLLDKRTYKFGGRKWKLVIYPKGFNNKGKKLSVYLYLVDSDKLSPNKTIYVEYTLRVKNHKRHTADYKKKVAYNFSPQATHGGGDTVSLKKVRNYNKGWLHNRDLTLELEVVAWSRVAKF